MEDTSFNQAIGPVKHPLQREKRDSIQLFEQGESSAASPESLYTPSMFENHLLEPADLSYKIRTGRSDNWIPLLIFFVFLIYLWIKVNFSGKIYFIARIFFEKLNPLSSRKREEISLFGKTSLMLYLCYTLVFSLFIYLILSYYKIDYPGPGGLVLYLKLFILISIIYMVKVTTAYLIGSLLHTGDLSNEYINNVLIFNILIGLVLFPFVICIYFISYVPPGFLIKTGAVILFLMFVYRTIRSVTTASGTRQLPKFYLFLYLCILEIFPFLILFKVIKRNLV